MLMLTRRRGQRIRLRLAGPGNEPVIVWLSIARIRGDSVSLGVEAPADVLIDREEIAEDRDLHRQRMKQAPEPGEERPGITAPAGPPGA